MDDWVHDIDLGEDLIDIFDPPEPASATEATASATEIASATEAASAAGGVSETKAASARGAATASASAVPTTGAASASAASASGAAVAKVHRRVLKRQSSKGERAGVLRRVLKRQASVGKPDDLKCEDRLCLWGGALKQPTVIHPVVRRGGTGFFPIVESLYWLRRACGGKQGQTHYTPRFQAALSSLRRTLGDGIRDKVDVVGAATDKLREALGLGDDDEEQSDQKPKRTLRRSEKAKCPDEVSVPLGDVVVKVRVRERPYEVEATSEAVMAVIAFCRKACGEGASADGASADKGKRGPPVKGEKEATFSFARRDCPPILHIITWHPSVSAWCVHYVDALKHKGVRRVPVKLPKKGNFLLDASADDDGSRAGWDSSRRKAYFEAVRLWNELDRSSRPRLDVPRLDDPRLDVREGKSE